MALEAEQDYRPTGPIARQRNSEIDGGEAPGHRGGAAGKEDSQLAPATAASGSTGRRTGTISRTWPFRSITGRNQPRDFIYCGPKWLRHLIVPEDPDHAIVYLDAVSEEIGIAAALSGDQAMRRMYESEDAHMAFAIMAGAAPPGATKATHGKVRKVYKTVSLGVLYGLSEYGIAERLGVDREVARALLSTHQELFPTYWSWSRETVEFGAPEWRGEDQDGLAMHRSVGHRQSRYQDMANLDELADSSCRWRSYAPRRHLPRSAGGPSLGTCP